MVGESRLKCRPFPPHPIHPCLNRLLPAKSSYKNPHTNLSRSQADTRTNPPRLCPYSHATGIRRLAWRSACIRVSGNFSALLTEPIKIRTERISGEVLLPETGREELDLKGGMRINALKHIDEVDIGINPL